MWPSQLLRIALLVSLCLVPFSGVAHGQGTVRCGRSGPDVIVGELNGISNYGTVGDITAFAVGTTSCNVGDEELLWFANQALHPVIAQNMYRLKDNRFEQIGMSWLKHGFFALSEDECGCGCAGTDGTTLGVGCSDPYTSGLNGSQSGLGPHFEVNATTGEYAYPFAFRGQTGNAIYKRLQVHNSDLNAAQNAGALYFVEGHYVTPDDAALAEKDNNASYQRVTVTPTGGTFTLSLVDVTEIERPAIQAWRDFDASVLLRSLIDPEDGLFRLASRCSDNGDGTFHYEYALYNMNSHRSARSFSVPIASDVVVTNLGFHDVDYHSGEPYDGTDWPGSVGGGVVAWSTSTFSTDENANALRWGTTYNFRFDANSAPQTATATVGYFRPGVDPETGQVSACIPSASPDVCIAAAPPSAPTASSQALNAKNRYLAIDPQNAGVNTALRVRLVSSQQFPGAADSWWWVGAPSAYCESGAQITPPCASVPGIPSRQFFSSSLQCNPHCTDWGALSDLLHIGDINIVPGTEYEIQAVACGCDIADESFFSALLPVLTSRHGDTLDDCATCPCGDPDGAINVIDCLGVIARFANALCAPLKTRVDLEPAVPDRQINTPDILQCITGFQGLPYSFSAPTSCVP